MTFLNRVNMIYMPYLYSQTRLFIMLLYTISLGHIGAVAETRCLLERVKKNETNMAYRRVLLMVIVTHAHPWVLKRAPPSILILSMHILVPPSLYMHYCMKPSDNGMKVRYMKADT